ncbi:MAG: IPT/TIG domain-containing protein [Deltaproteobacteria bacterium]|nr:IPT/TIG domain-containing protein [Deltaproteobacteria bacterium]
MNRWWSKLALMGLLVTATGCKREGVFFQALNPSQGRASGGEEVRLRGSGFKTLGNLEIRIGGRPATNVGIADDETIVLTTPDARDADQGHPLDMFILTSEGRSFRLRDSFTYRRAPGDPNAPNSELQRRM